MDISTPIVGFFFVCIAMPQLVKNRSMFTISFGVLLGILVLDLIAHATIGGFAIVGGFSRFLFILRGVLWIAEVVLLVLATGGMSLREQVDSMTKAFDAVRTEETKSEEKAVTPTEQKPL